MSVYLMNRMLTVFDGIMYSLPGSVVVLYTFSKGVGTLYINGQLVQRQENVSYTPRCVNFLVGIEATFRLSAMHGSVGELVIFDRALGATEVKEVAEITKPHTLPAWATIPFDDPANVIMVNDQPLSVKDLSTCSAGQLRMALEILERVVATTVL